MKIRLECLTETFLKTKTRRASPPDSGNFSCSAERESRLFERRRVCLATLSFAPDGWGSCRKSQDLKKQLSKVLINKGRIVPLGDKHAGTECNLDRIETRRFYHCAVVFAGSHRIGDHA